MVKESSTIQVKVRMSRAFHHELMREARRNDRTLNSEILARLGAVYKSDTLPSAEPEFAKAALRAFEQASARFSATEERLRRLEEAQRGKPVSEFAQMPTKAEARRLMQEASERTRAAMERHDKVTSDKGKDND
jgi:hypothetical protein